MLSIEKEPLILVESYRPDSYFRLDFVDNITPGLD